MLNSCLYSSLDKWKTYIELKQNDRAKKLLKSVIYRINKKIIKNKQIEETARNNALHECIILRGIIDFTDIDSIMRSTSVITDHDTLENLWILLWDCRERILVKNYIPESQILVNILKELDLIEAKFDENYGKGIYTSMVTKIKSEICSICKENIKLCDHKAGSFYNGIRCIGIVEDFELITSDIVENPEDKRCRIWPWRVKEVDGKKIIEQVIIHRIFKVDDF
ncbi:MAG: hypothetical protein GW761_12090 [Leptospira sp.]|nr:hypothetical protein [Leptospira sp.]